MSALSEDDLASLKSALQRTRRQPLNFAVGLGKAPEEHRLSLHATRAGRALAKEIKEATGLKQITWGTTEVDDSRKDTLVLALEDKALTGLAKKLAAWLKLHGLPVRKVAVKVGGVEQDESEGEDGEPPPGNAAPDPALAALDTAFKQMAARIKPLIEQDRSLDALLLPAAKACQRALQQGERAMAEAALKQLALRIKEAQDRLSQNAADFQDALSPLESPLGQAVDKVRQLQADPQVQRDRQLLAKTSATIAQTIKQARLAARKGQKAEAEALAALLAEERKAARKVLAPYWPGGAQNPDGDWSLVVARLDLSSPKDGAVFWSGDKDNAIDLAIDRGGISLESTGGGAMIDDWNDTKLPWSGDNGDPPPYLMVLWQLASATYAIQAEGIITAIQTPEKQLTDGGEMWRRVERKILRKRELQGRVTLTAPVIKPANKKV